MLYFFSGNSDYLIKKQLLAWKEKFLSKYGEFNFTHIKNIGESEKITLSDNLLASSFMGDKKLLFINLMNLGKDILNEDKQSFLLNILDKVPEENLVLFYSVNPDKRTKIFKELKNKTEFKEFNLESDQIQNLLSQKYNGQINPQALKDIIQYKSYHIEKIESEINKLLINFDFITTKDVKDNISLELEESVFVLIDEILNLHINAALIKLDIILSNDTVYAIYNNLLANLRTTVYIQKLKSFRLTTSEIISILGLGNRAFLVNKSYRIDFQSLQKLYVSMIQLDKKMKSGFFLGSDDADFQLEIEKCLLQL